MLLQGEVADAGTCPAPRPLQLMPWVIWEQGKVSLQRCGRVVGQVRAAPFQNILPVLGPSMKLPAATWGGSPLCQPLGDRPAWAQAWGPQLPRGHQARRSGPAGRTTESTFSRPKLSQRPASWDRVQEGASLPATRTGPVMWRWKHTAVCVL